MFKDSKPTNWIFTDKDLYLIDFDYVVPSSSLANISQLTNYCDLRMDERKEILKRYYEFEERDIPICSYWDLYILTCVNSRIAAMNHNSHLDDNLISKFKKQNISDLSIIKLV
jgi:thiamine kinase-like enzyme